MVTALALVVLPGDTQAGRQTDRQPSSHLTGAFLVTTPFPRQRGDRKFILQFWCSKETNHKAVLMHAVRALSRALGNSLSHWEDTMGPPVTGMEGNPTKLQATTRCSPNSLLGGPLRFVSLKPCSRSPSPFPIWGRCSRLSCSHISFPKTSGFMLHLPRQLIEFVHLLYFQVPPYHFL